MKKTVSLTLVAAILTALLLVFPFSASAEEYPFDLDAKSAILMDATTGTVLYEANADAALPPASVTKVMTLLLVMEAIDEGRISLHDSVSISEAAASMGGSQVYLEPGETMSVEELLKCVIIASANDAAYALAEHVAGSEEAFVKRMNERARELQMLNTHFENTNGLDDTVTEHLTSARDIAIMSRELISHEKILEYTTIWQDTIRNGSFTLSNTNRLVRFYPGATGLKTGSTSKALFCISATAKRGELHLIAVIMGSPTRDVRNAEAKKLLDYGFSTYASYSDEGEAQSVPIRGGVADALTVRCRPFAALLGKGEEKRVEKTYVLPEYVTAPVKAGDVIGTVEYRVGDRLVGKADILADEEVPRIAYTDILWRLVRTVLGAEGFSQ
ncbi:MAG: D-alanyl-D-alanine carboxypeptidase [Clostridia bacterium]|nr:D-alanyl-D-alanine carboxypeptidase [Clostridia bacterium]